MAGAGGLATQTQQSFAAGMYRNGSRELIPGRGTFDLGNLLLDLLGNVFKRGGSSYRSGATFGAGLRWLWDGWLANGQQTLLASEAAFGRLNGDGTVTSLGEGGLTHTVRPAVFLGKLYFPGGKTYDGTTWATDSKAADFYAVVANRVVAAKGNRIDFSEIGKATYAVSGTDFHLLPEGVQILGMEGSRDSCVVFTTGGVWVISNMSLNLTDEKGDVQHRLDHYSGDLILWGDGGIASWEGSLIVPGTDAVWLVKRGVTSEVVGSFERISDSIHDLYRSYVRDGYQPGRAVVFGNHYLLPVIGLGTVVDVLVCRLDTPPARGENRGAWSHLAGYGAAVGAYATRVSGGVAREPELLGALYGADSRVLTCSYFEPSQAVRLDADASGIAWSLETRSFPTSNAGVPTLVAKLRARYQLHDDEGVPAITCEVANDTPIATGSTWGNFVWGIGTWATAGEGSYSPLEGEAPPDLEATKPYVWKVRRKVAHVRFRLTSKAPAATAVIKSLELFVRPQGRI